MNIQQRTRNPSSTCTKMVSAINAVLQHRTIGQCAGDQACCVRPEPPRERLSVEGYRISDGRRIVSFCGPTPDTTSPVARLFSNAWTMTKEMLRGAGLSVPDGELFAPHQGDEGLERLVRARSSSGRKANSRKAAGLELLQTSKAETISPAWKVARDAKTKPIIVEEHICGA